MAKQDNSRQQLPLYISSPQSCDYLADKQSQNIFIAPDIPVTPDLYGHLLGIGFRRSGKHAYRPHCPACRACIPCRVDSTQFKPSRSQKRVLAKNNDLSFNAIRNDFSEQHFHLYQRYQAGKHPGGTMEHFNADEYQSFLCQSFGNSLVYETRLNDQLLAVSVTDVFSNALSAVYTYFDPAYASRSLGTYSVLKQIELAMNAGQQFVYLGYYIQASNKMAYKANFRPLQLLINGDWCSFNKGEELPMQNSCLDVPLSF